MHPTPDKTSRDQPTHHSRVQRSRSSELFIPSGLSEVNPQGDYQGCRELSVMITNDTYISMPTSVYRQLQNNESESYQLDGLERGHVVRDVGRGRASPARVTTEVLPESR